MSVVSATVEKIVPEIINCTVCFVIRTNAVIVLNGDQSFFPEDGRELMSSWLAEVPVQS